MSTQKGLKHITVDGNVATAVFEDGTVIRLGQNLEYQGKNVQKFNIMMEESQ